ncbi:hypothetical protein ANN_23231 [Periplaneta americana]|uniref:Uncharacterized protein n=1 Tax=Periplaneta americana TaxID=6978 RepID=A0ABQ8SKI3_PERAM|nr:hypothetical protein ANN_23231 [Periplaneta americana]
MAGLCEDGNERPGFLKANKFRATECTERKKSVIWPTEVTEDAVEDARERMQRGPNKSVKKLAVDIGVSYGNAHKILRNKLESALAPRLGVYQVLWDVVMSELKKDDPPISIRFTNAPRPPVKAYAGCNKKVRYVKIWETFLTYGG